MVYLDIYHTYTPLLYLIIFSNLCCAFAVQQSMLTLLCLKLQMTGTVSISELREAQSLLSFKQKLRKTQCYSVNKLLFHFNGRASVQHCRMRMGLSALKSQLFRLNICETPVCEICDIEAEDTLHYFLHCPVFHVERTRLLSAICELLPFDSICDLTEHDLVGLFLRGYVDCSLQTNISIFTHVLAYIESTGRFT